MTTGRTGTSKKRPSAQEVEKTKKVLKNEVGGLIRWAPSDSISTGSTLLNLAINDDPAQGFRKGLFYFLVGDSRSGKTWLSLSCLAEAARDPKFAEYRFIHDNVEYGALMDIGYYFGEETAKRLEAPAYEQGLPVYSHLVEDFYYNLSRCLDDGPCIYILDSMDGLTSERETQRFNTAMEEAGKGKRIGDDMTDGKAKINAKGIRAILPKLRDTGSILIVINQTRASIGGGPFQEKSRSGGFALTFYAAVELWSSIMKTKTKEINGKKRAIGVDVKIKVKKNRVTGKSREIEIPIYYDYGIDDLGSCIDFLIAEKHWKKTGTLIDISPDFANAKPLTRTKLIDMLEREGYEGIVYETAGTVWKSIEDSCCQSRKRRYS